MEINKPPLSDGNICAAERMRKKLQFNCTLQSTLYHLKLLNETIVFFFFQYIEFLPTRDSLN